MFLKPILDFYEKNCKIASTDKKAQENLQKLMNVIPPIKQLKVGLANRFKRENIIYRLVMEILLHYLSDKNLPKVNYIIINYYDQFPNN